MKTTMRVFIEKYPDVIKAIKVCKFREAKIFKGVCPSEKNVLNILVVDDETVEEPVTHRCYRLSVELTHLLRCEVVVNTPDEVDPFYKEKLNAVNLTDEIPNEKLKHVFGDNWVFSSFGFSSKKNIKELESSNNSGSKFMCANRLPRSLIWRTPEHSKNEKETKYNKSIIKSNGTDLRKVILTV